MALFEVKYTVYTDKSHMNFDPNLWDCTELVQAISAYQAQALIEAKFNGMAVVTAIIGV